MFDLDEYVFGALKAGASGFLLKTAPPAQLAATVRACHAGEMLLAPTVTRRLLETYVRQPPPTPRIPLAPTALTPGEIEILRAIARGLSNAEIAAELYLGESTAKTHVTRILSKLDLRDRVQAVALAYETGLVHPQGLTAHPLPVGSRGPAAPRVPPMAIRLTRSIPVPKQRTSEAPVGAIHEPDANRYDCVLNGPRRTQVLQAGGG